ncbi:efflux RND transporter periplasmic adaptor subunit [Primorskyibacter sp. S87]|uniref:efflux RND transporter periplasmic adaptor subunit n=1 Tax=Primorskyibacter sp. S87 TaxID=3415126 RepID=UPI003C7DD541
MPETNTIHGKSVVLGAFLLAASTLPLIADDAARELGAESATGIGLVVAAKSWDVSAAAENQIDTIHFIEGQFVKEGDLLVTFDQVFKQWDAKIGELAHRQAVAELELAQADLSRKKRLGTNSVSEVEIAQAEARVKIAEATVETKRLNAEKAKAISDLQLIHAPFDGQMSAPRFRDNANVVADSPEIGTLYQLDPIHIRVEGTYEKHQQRILEGETHDSVMGSLTLVLELPGGSEFPHHGRLISTPFEFDPETGIGYSIAEFPNPEFLLRPGMKVQITSFENSN